MTTHPTRAQSETRLAVVDLRQRLELVAGNAVTDSFPGKGVLVNQTQIGQRLAFIVVAYESKASLSELIGILRVARHIYSRTSDVLHGRSSMVNLSPVLLDEWDAFVEHIEELAQKGGSAE